MPTAFVLGKPDAGNPPVRFDEGRGGYSSPPTLPVHFLPNQKRLINYLLAKAPAAASAGQSALPVTTKPICSIMR
jgi:hypothetical protein